MNYLACRNSNNHVNNVKCMTSKSQMLIHKSMENIIEKEIAETGNVSNDCKC